MFYIYFVSLSLKVRLDYSSLKTDNKEKIDNMETKTKQLEHQLVCVIATVVIATVVSAKATIVYVWTPLKPGVPMVPTIKAVYCIHFYYSNNYDGCYCLSIIIHHLFILLRLQRTISCH